MTVTPPDAENTVRMESDARCQRRSAPDGQFAPATLVAGRYRIATIPGKGGMGEVYRTDDIKLAQTQGEHLANRAVTPLPFQSPRAV